LGTLRGAPRAAAPDGGLAATECRRSRDGGPRSLRPLAPSGVVQAWPCVRRPKTRPAGREISATATAAPSGAHVRARAISSRLGSGAASRYPPWDDWEHVRARCFNLAALVAEGVREYLRPADSRQCTAAQAIEWHGAGQSRGSGSSLRNTLKHDNIHENTDSSKEPFGTQDCTRWCKCVN